ncbi:MAG: zinc-ribbon domain-containing protein [Candidatus Sulfotelmatobacter sp.]
MRCGRCGNENAEGNRFCGMCGATLVGKTPPDARVAPAANSPASKLTPVPARPLAAPQPSLFAAGPAASVAGERRPAPVSPSTSPSALASDDPRETLRPSSNLDYLLDDDEEEEESRRGWGKLILAVVALALAVGFGYLHWQQGGFNWLNAGIRTPLAAPAPDAAQGSAGSGTMGTSAATSGNSPVTNAGGSETTPAEATTPNPTSSQTAAQSTASPAPVQAASQTTASPAAAQPTPPQTPPATAPQATPLPPAAAPSATPQNVVPQSAAKNSDSQNSVPQSSAAQNSPGESNAPADSAASAAASDANAQSAPAEAPAVAQPVTRKPAIARPSAPKPVDPVTEAERYINGQGVRQDCGRGMRLLKTAAAQSNAKALISMGMLYTTGTCTPRDLPTAYRWLALALHKEPDNQALQDDLQKLWSQMTEPERQVAIQLSQ